MYCVSSYAGEGFGVCHNPALAEDVNINRQFRNITKLYGKLDSLLNQSDVSATPPDDPQPSDSKKKKNFKIWFSPKSRKIRCRIEKPVVLNLSGRNEKKKPATISSEPKDLSVFNFNSSSQDSDSSTPPRRKVNKKEKSKRVIPAASKKACGDKRPVTWTQMKRECKRLKLEAINHRWGFGTEGDFDSKDEDNEKVSSRDDDRKSSKRVSFQCSGKHQKMVSQIVRRDESILNNLEVEDVRPGCEKQNNQLPKSNENTPVPSQLSPSGTLKRAGEDPQNTPKISSEETASQAFDLTDDSLHRIKTSKQVEEKQIVKAGLSMSGRGSPATSVLVKRSTVVRSNRGSPAYMKRNHNGETPLHLASIKGDVEEVRKLLAQGADPNLKDNAGWTPLHEACYFGHLAVVGELLQQGALINTPGYQNHSPLHDAVRNGHVMVVKLLVERGASQTVLNMFGLRPVDYALAPELQDVLKTAPEAPDPVTAALCPSASHSKYSGCVRESGGPMVLIGSQLSPTQKKQLAEAARLLGGKPVESFSNAVTHVVVPDVSSMPITLTTLLGILNGCWVVCFKWVCCSLQAGVWAEASVFETGGGPLRSRVNRDSLLPPLFDGCFFYLMGSFHKPPKTELLQLIKNGGGQLLNRQPKPDSDVTQTVNTAAYHAQPGSDQTLCTQYILYDPQSSFKPLKVRVGKVWWAPSTWLLNCVAAFQLLSVSEL